MPIGLLAFFCHIVGFGSFFVWTLYTESDLLKSDHNLLDKSDAETLTGRKGK